MSWKIGDTSRKYEVGPRGGPTTVSTGKGDNGRSFLWNVPIIIQDRNLCEVR